MSDRIWSEEQKAIFQWFASGRGNLVVQARAGTGKTTTIVEAFAHAPEARICYVVFNKKNQVEAQAKVTDARVDVKTLHALGYSYIRSRWNNVKVDGLVEFDRIRQVARTFFKNDVPNEIVTQVARLVSFAKNMLPDPTPDQIAALAIERGIDAGEDWEGSEYTLAFMCKLAGLALIASKAQDAQGRISFDDMVWLPVAMHWVTPRYDLVVVDEAQDMNVCQLLMATHAVRKTDRICIVGDDRQAIYGFRGAAQDGMGMMQRELNACVLGLTTTYRCPKAVVALANKIVADYVAAPTAPEGIVDEASEDRLLATVKPGDAILSRANAPLMPLCLFLLRAGVPARIEGREVGKAMAALVKKLNARTVPDLLGKVVRWSARGVRRALAANHSKQADMIQDQAETIKAIAEGCSGVSEVIHRFETMFDDSDGNRKPTVVLSTVHKAKGLEWEHVYLLSATFRSACEEGEESNIYYVAVTRTKSHLTMVS